MLHHPSLFLPPSPFMLAKQAKVQGPQIYIFISTSILHLPSQISFTNSPDLPSMSLFLPPSPFMIAKPSPSYFFNPPHSCLPSQALLSPKLKALQGLLPEVQALQIALAQDGQRTSKLLQAQPWLKMVKGPQSSCKHSLGSRWSKDLMHLFITAMPNRCTTTMSPNAK